jgi:hypothetical protein
MNPSCARLNIRGLMSSSPLNSDEVPGRLRLVAWPAGQSLASSDLPAFQGITITEVRSFPPPDDPKCWVYITLNAEIELTCQPDPGLRALVDGGRARISVDSQWIWWAPERRHDSRAPQKMSGSDLICALADHCVAHGQKLCCCAPRCKATATPCMPCAPGAQASGSVDSRPATFSQTQARKPLRMTNRWLP